MRDWIKPELVVEEFELSQHVASGCVIKLGAEKSRYGNGKEFTFTWAWSKGNIDTSKIKYTYPKFTAWDDKDEDGLIDGNEYLTFVAANSGPQSAPNSNWTHLYKVDEYTLDQVPYNS